MNPFDREQLKIARRTLQLSDEGAAILGGMTKREAAEVIRRLAPKREAAPIASFNGKWRFLSNFFLHPVQFEGLLYPSTEHAYQAAKSLDSQIRQEICALKTCGEAKRRGKEIEARPDWEEVKLDIMRQVVRSKFEDAELRAKLDATAPRTLIEGNRWHDNIWGVCKCKDCPGKGKNLLGVVLMEIRDQ